MKNKSLDGPWLGGETVWVLLMVLAIFIFIAVIDGDARKRTGAGAAHEAHGGPHVETHP